MIRRLIILLLIVGCEETVAPLTIHGCLDSTACNYDADATIDNNSCIYETDCSDVCGGEDISCLGCDDVKNSGLVFDECGVCGGNNSSCYGNAQIMMTMSDSNTLTVAVSQFTSVKLMTLHLEFNPSYTISNFINGNFNVVYNGTNGNASFLFGDIQGDGNLFTVDFNSNGASMEGTTISIGHLDMRLSNNEPVYMTCQGNETYINDVSCEANGYQWTYSTNENGFPDEFTYQSVCYISEHPTNGEVLFGGEYQWTNAYCWPIQAPW